MQEGVREEELMLNAIEQALAGMSGLEKMMLGLSPLVSLRCHYT